MTIYNKQPSIRNTRSKYCLLSMFLIYSMASSTSYAETINISANSTLFDPHTSILKAKGNVVLSYKQHHIFADDIKISAQQSQALIELIDNFVIKTDLLIINGNNAKLQEANSAIEAQDLTIKFTQGLSNGTIKSVNTVGDFLIIDQAVYQSGGSTKNGWKFKADQIIKSNLDNSVTFKNLRFYAGSIPLLWSPYLKYYPATKSFTGLESPLIKNTSNGPLIYLNSYWHIKDGLDLSYTPKVFLKHGVQHHLKLTYQNALLGQSQVILEHQSKATGYKHNPSLSYLNYSLDKTVANWKFKVNHSVVNNPYYFDLATSDFGYKGQKYLNNSYTISYHQAAFDSQFAIFNFPNLANNKTTIYQARPQLKLSYKSPFEYQTALLGADFIATRFQDNLNLYPAQNRLVLNPYLAYSWRNPWLINHNQLKLYSRFYSGSKEQLANRDSLASASVVPELSSSLITNLIGDQLAFNSYLQKLQLAANFSYRPNNKTSQQLQTFDSSSKGPIAKLFDFNDLSHLNDYYGHDLISSSKKLTLAANYQLIDHQDLTQKLAITLQYQKELAKNNQANYLNNSWIINSLYNVNQNLRLNNTVALSNDLQLNFSKTGINYQIQQQLALQLSHSYLKPINLNNSKIVKLNQIGLAMDYRISQELAVRIANYYDLTADSSVQQELKFAYSNCCWAINLGFERYPQIGQKEIKQETKLVFNIQLNDLNPGYYYDSFNQVQASGVIKNIY